MTPLPFNMLIPQSMRPKLQIGLAILPIGLMFASFLPLFMLIPLLESASGIPHGAPVKSQVNGWLWVAVIIFTMVAGMVLGYLIGWIFNALISRYVFGWTASKIVAVYWRSELPNHWFIDKFHGQDTPRVSSNTLSKWETHRSAGPMRFILLRGVLTWGMPMFFVMYIAPAWSRKRDIVFIDLIFNLALWAASGAVFGAAIWYLSEWNYRKARKHSQTKNQSS
jgi:hypothetical protein